MTAGGINNTRIGGTQVDGRVSSKEKENLVTDGASFKSALELQAAEMGGPAAPLSDENKVINPTLKFSNHAVERMSSRGIHFTAEQMTRIENAARKAADKGAKETLIFADDSALIVSLKNNTVVTVMDKNSLKENVFTKIDSTVVV